jgi:hypothetical protein
MSRALGEGMMSPLKANLEGVTIEYGLYGGRFWLPPRNTRWPTRRLASCGFPSHKSRSPTPASTARAIPAVPFRWCLRDSLFRTIPVHGRPSGREQGAQSAIARAAATGRNSENARAAGMFGDRLPHSQPRSLRWNAPSVRVPCDSTVLLNSPDLAESICSGRGPVRGEGARRLLKALDFSLQSGERPCPSPWTTGGANPVQSR